MQAESVQNELAESKQALDAARSEVECLREMVTSWEEAFGKAQQELESLKASSIASGIRCKVLQAVMMPVRRRGTDFNNAYACFHASATRLMPCAKYTCFRMIPGMCQDIGRNEDMQSSQPLSKPR